MKKKIASLSMLLCLLAVFFVIPVHAENTYVRNIRTYSGYKSSVSLTYSATACQFHYNSDTALEGGVYSPVLITVRFTNNGSNDVKIANSYIDLTFTSTAEVQGFDCYTTDLMVQVAGTAGQHTPRYNIIGGDGFSYNGHIVVPHNSSIYLVFEIDIAGSINTSTSQPEGPGLDAVFVSVADADVQTGEFVSGIIPRQLDSIETLIGTIVGYVYGDNQNLVTLMQQVGSIKNLLTEIKSLIQFTGSYSQNNTGTNYVSYNTTLSNSGAIINISYRYLRSYYLTDDIEISGSNTLIKSGTRVTPAVLYITINTGAKTIETSPSWTITGLDSLTKEVTGFYSDDFEMPSIININQVLLPLKNRIQFNGYISDIRNHYSVLYMNIYTDANNDPPVTTNLTLGLNYNREALSNIYIPGNEYYILRDIFQYIQSPSQQNTGTVTDSNNAGAMSDQVHAQEEQWYRDNDTAMENVGLSNYRYTQNQQNGIVGAVLQFEQMWLALGDWTLVYIFTLMLSLAVFILRHEPTTRMKQAREERSAFYAEAGRYYRESARPSNEFVQRVRKFNGK